MISLNETLIVYDLAEGLQGESGKFEITTPKGERFTVTCTPGHSIGNLRVLPDNGTLNPFRVRKVADIPSTQETVK